MKNLSLKNWKLTTLILLLLLLLTVLLHPQIDVPLYAQLAVDPVSLSIAAATTVSSLIGSILNSSSADDANRLNERNFRESMDFQKYQFENLKRYNSLQNKASQARAAGLNPILAMEGVNSNMSAVSSPSANPIQPIDYTSAFSSAGELGNSLSASALAPSQKAAGYAQAAKDTASATGQSIDNITKPQLNIANLKKAGYDTDMASLLLGLNRETFASNVRNTWLETQRRELENENLGLKNTTDSIIQGFLPTQVWAQVNNTLADTRLKLAMKDINWVQARAAAQQAAAAVMNAAKSNGMIVSDKQAKDLADAYIESLSASAFNSYLSPKSSKKFGVGLKGLELEDNSPTYMGYYKAFRHITK